jgi:hypothetical protein
MATTTTFTTLSADLANYLERGGSSLTDPTVAAQIPRLINLAERKLAEALKLQGQIEVFVDAPAGLQMGNPVVTKPDRWRETVELNYGAGAGNNSRTNLFGRSYGYCRYYWPDSTQTGPPELYADYDYYHWLVVPTPDQNYPLEGLLYMQPALLDQNNQSNFFSTYAPAALLYGSLIEASAFLKDDQRIGIFTPLWQQELQLLDQMDLQRILDRASERRLP